MLKYRNEILRLLKEQDFEDISAARPLSGENLEVDVNKIIPVLNIDGVQLYASVPMHLVAKIDDQGHFSVDPDSPDASAVDSARNFVERLVRTGNLAGLPGQSDTAVQPFGGRKPTHRIEVDGRGRHIVRRARFYSR